MSTPIIGGGDGVRNAIAEVETASINWNQTQREYGEACFAQMKQCLKDIASGGTGEAFPFPAP